MDNGVITFQVFGVPVPKGSMKAFMRPGMRFPVVTHDNLQSKPWADTIRLVAQQHAPAGGPWEGPIELHASFYLPKPKSLPRRCVYPVKKPDTDKLLRNLKDALKGVIYRDDAQVIDVHASKRYATSEAPPQVYVTIRKVNI